MIAKLSSGRKVARCWKGKSSKPFERLNAMPCFVFRSRTRHSMNFLTPCQLWARTSLGIESSITGVPYLHIYLHVVSVDGARPP